MIKRLRRKLHKARSPNLDLRCILFGILLKSLDSCREDIDLYREVIHLVEKGRESRGLGFDDLAQRFHLFLQILVS